MSEPAKDDLAEIRAELKRRGALPQRSASASVVEFQPTDNAYLVILAEAVNRLAKSVAEMRASQPASGPRVRTIERDAEGNITRIVEE